MSDHPTKESGMVVWRCVRCSSLDGRKNCPRVCLVCGCPSLERIPVIPLATHEALEKRLRAEQYRTAFIIEALMLITSKRGSRSTDALFGAVEAWKRARAEADQLQEALGDE